MGGWPVAILCKAVQGVLFSKKGTLPVRVLLSPPWDPLGRPPLCLAPVAFLIMFSLLAPAQTALSPALSGRLTGSRKQIRSPEGAAASPATLPCLAPESVLCPGGLAEPNSLRGTGQADGVHVLSHLRCHQPPSLLLSLVHSWPEGSRGTQFRATGTQMCGKLGFQLQSVLGWEFGQGHLPTRFPGSWGGVGLAWEVGLE